MRVRRVEPRLTDMFTLYPYAVRHGGRAIVSEGDDEPSVHAELEAALAKVAELQAALRSSREIGMAMGIVMERHRLSADRTFLVLQQISSRRNVKLRDVAEQIVATGEVPT